MRGINLSITTLRIYDEILNKPKTYQQLKDNLTIPNSTLSLCLQKLTKQNLIKKIILSNQVHYTISEDNIIEKIRTNLSKNLTPKEKVYLSNTLTSLIALDTKFPEKYSLALDYVKKYISQTKLIEDFYLKHCMDYSLLSKNDLSEIIKSPTNSQLPSKNKKIKTKSKKT